jgi:hypothetical protein
MTAVTKARKKFWEASGKYICTGRKHWIRKPSSMRSLQSCFLMLGVDLYSRSRSTGKCEGLSLRGKYGKEQLSDMAHDAYKDACRDSHPDLGGDHDDMVLVNEAYNRILHILNYW